MGAFSAALLATFEKVIGRWVVERSSLNRGSSSSRMIDVGLAMRARSEEVCWFRQTCGAQPIPAGGGMRAWTRLPRNLVRPKLRYRPGGVWRPRLAPPNIVDDRYSERSRPPVAAGASSLVS